MKESKVSKILTNLGVMIGSNKLTQKKGVRRTTHVKSEKPSTSGMPGCDTSPHDLVQGYENKQMQFQHHLQSNHRITKHEQYKG